MANTPISFKDYQRIVRVTSAVLCASGDYNAADLAKSCVYFAYAGAFLLKHAHKLDARPAAGMALYQVRTTLIASLVVAYGDFNGKTLKHAIPDGTAKSNRFHCWVECGSWVIDFMAPFFNESLPAELQSPEIPRKMFQRRRDEMAASPFKLKHEGDFFLDEELRSTKYMLEYFAEYPGAMDLVEVCARWYRPWPQSLPTNLAMASSDRPEVNLTLSGPTVDGVW